MEVFLIIMIIATLVVIISLKNDISSKFVALHGKIDSLSDELKRLRSRLEQVSPKPGDIGSPKTQESVTVVKTSQPVIIEVKPVPEKKEVVVAPVEAFVKPGSISSPATKTTTQPVIATPPKPGFFERNPDLEKFIGENLANKIGIGILVLGIGFFVKYAIDQEWINEIGRVFIGVLCGGVLLGVAHRLRKTFAAFSSVLVGGGIAVLYLTITIAFQEYQLMSQTAAFIIMIIITGFTVLLSLGYNRIELAILAILGGFGSPFMVSTGEGNYIVLFTYILILDVGMLVLAYYKKWNLVTIVAYGFTLILYGSWLATEFDGEKVPMITGAIIFATLFYMVFFAMNIINNIKERAPFKAIEIGLLISNTFFYYTFGMVALSNEYGNDFRGLFTALLGVFNFLFAFLLYKNQRVDRNLVYLLIGLVLTFISLAAPIQLEGNYITLFWAAETVLLLWLSQKSGIRLMKIASIIIMGLMLISLLMDWDQLYLTTAPVLSMSIILNKAYITGLFAIASIGGVFYLLGKEEGASAASLYVYKVLLAIAGVIVVYFVHLLELRYHLVRFEMDESARAIITGSYNMFFILTLLLVQRKVSLPEGVRNAFSAWGVIAILSYIFYYHGQIINARDHYLYAETSSLGFFFHYILTALLIGVTIITLNKTQTLTKFNQDTHHAYSWFYVFFFVMLASAELDHAVLMFAFGPGNTIDHLLTQNHKIGFPILWGVASFLLIAIGLKQKKRHLRIISLSLFLITLLKLFLVDIRGISEGGKIAAFISLGILLLIVSFMYQRIKKLLLTEEPVSEGEKANTL